MNRKPSLIRAPYETPQVQTYSATELLRLLGPAVAVYGGLPGAF